MQLENLRYSPSMSSGSSTKRPSFLAGLDQWPMIHTIIRLTRARDLIRWALSRFPIQRTLEDSGIRYRIRSLEGFLVADEMFNRGVYDRAIRDKPIQTFIDLGCNIGLFPCLLAHRSGRRDLRGLVIDANEATLDETRWHLVSNQLTEIRSARGLVGAVEGGGDTGDFYISPSELGSSQFTTPAPGQKSKGDWKKLRIPIIEVGELWRQHFGQQRVDLLKIDIEGSEEAFLKNETEFLRQVDAIVMEVHRWLVDPEQIERVLLDAGFGPPELFVDEGSTEILYCQRS
jgi:FkbM family methyltransferase